MLQNKQTQNGKENVFKTLVFTQKDLFLNPEDIETPYRRRKDDEKTAISWGQRKLLITLVQFLTYFWKVSEVPNPVIVYAGAAPGISIAIASLLFPEVTFHCYDPLPYKIKSTKKIKLYQDFFTDETAKYWGEQQKKDKNIFFISDIRTADYLLAKDLDDNESQIWGDMENQKRWHKIIKPVKSHLKFRLPYTGGNRPEEVKYLYGYLLKQPYAGQTSTESRLVPLDNDTETLWSCRKYQSQMFHHNIVVREKYKYLNPFTNDLTPLDGEELTNEWDYRAESQVWMDYLQVRTGKVDWTAVKALSRSATTKITEKRRYKDTLKYLRSHPRAIKDRNIKPSREDIDNVVIQMEQDEDLLLLESLGVM